MPELDGKKILLGVTGGIAAYKSPDLVRRLRERGGGVAVVMTAGALRFVTPTTFQAVSGRPVRSDLWDEAAEAAMGHIELARWADAVVVAPASADFMARLAAGLANDLLTTLCLATDAPVVLAPAMNRLMWANAATVANVATLRGRGVELLGPGTGDQACGETGEGRMLEPVEIVESLTLRLAGNEGRLSGRRVVVTAGPTREPIDPVRYITNRSSGKMGYAVAAAARSAGADVTLVSGPVNLPTPAGITRIDVQTAAEMDTAVQSAVTGADVFIGAAAIADYAPATVAEHKIKKKDETMRIELTKVTDVLAAVAARADRPFVVGFAAETRDLEANALAKLEQKRLDMIAANLVGPGVGFDCDHNTLRVFWPGGSEDLGQASKETLAARLIDIIADRILAPD
jgi:phosphopantothenoylcysteine decarboxylase/phosphopantothenate--cysteine ligase